MKSAVEAELIIKAVAEMDPMKVASVGDTYFSYCSFCDAEEDAKGHTEHKNNCAWVAAVRYMAGT